MDIFSGALAVVSGICLGTGAIYLFVGLRRQGSDMVHLTFGLFALAYGFAVLFGLLMYRSTTLPSYLAVDRWSGIAAVLTQVFLIWFVAVYTDEHPLPVLAVLAVLYGAALAAHLARPTLIHGAISAIALEWEMPGRPVADLLPILAQADSPAEILIISRPSSREQIRDVAPDASVFDNPEELINRLYALQAA